MLVHIDTKYMGFFHACLLKKTKSSRISRRNGKKRPILGLKFSVKNQRLTLKHHTVFLCKANGSKEQLIIENILKYLSCFTIQKTICEATDLLCSDW